LSKELKLALSRKPKEVTEQKIKDLHSSTTGRGNFDRHIQKKLFADLSGQ